MKTAYSILIYALLACSSFGAGWDTNAWSGDYHRYYLDASTNKVFIKEALSSDAFAAIEERADAAGVSAATTNAWFRNNRADLVNIKSWVVSHVSKFILVDIPSPSFSTDTGSYSNSLRTCVTGTVSKDKDHGLLTGNNTFTNLSTSLLITTLSLPTNYFTSTPWRKLTDPSTSNGWHFLDDICNLLTVKEAFGSWDNSGETNRLRSSGSSSVWTTAVANANSSLIFETSDDRFPRKSGQAKVVPVGGGGTCSYSLFQETIYQYPVFDSGSTNECEASIYAHFLEQFLTTRVAYPYDDAYSDGFINYNSYGLSGIPTNAGLALLQSYTNISGVVTSSVAVGDAALGTPQDPSQPNDSSVGFKQISRNDWEDFEAAGWTVVGNPLVVFDYASTNLTNGFTYYAD